MSCKIVMERLAKDADLLEELARVARENGITKGSIQVIGALQKASIGFYRQEEQKYESHDIDAEVELLAGMGNISMKDGEPFVHLHLMLGLDDGAAKGGHAMEGCTIFAAEAVITEIPGAALNRVFDESTGLFLWG